jgi:hypothetical protein
MVLRDQAQKELLLAIVSSAPIHGNVAQVSKAVERVQNLLSDINSAQLESNLSDINDVKQP